MRPIIDNNQLFLAMPPLLKYNTRKNFYAYDEIKDRIIKKEFSNKMPITLSRYKIRRNAADQLKSTP